MSDRADDLIKKLEVAHNDEELVSILKDQKHLFFYRIGILDNERRLLYDSHTKRLLGPSYFPLQFITHSEIEEALEWGVGYSEEYSHLLGQKLIYVAKRFDFQGKPYVLRLAFPFQYIQDLREDFTIGFLFFSSLILILFSAMTALVLNHLSSPIREIISSIRSFKEGQLETLPNIQLKTPPQDDFTHLANTINTLSQRLRLEIETITKERNERNAILDTLSDGVMAVDSSYVISYANKNALSFLGLRSEAIHQPFPDSLHPKYHEILASSCREARVISCPLEVGYGTQKQFLHLIALPRVNEGGTLLVIQDISIQHKIIEMRKAFIANASHELKTPITIIRGFAETLQDNPDLPQETVSVIMQKIVNSCTRMTKIIRNLLTLADIENLPSFRVVPTNVKHLLERIRETTLSVYQDATINIEAAVDSSREDALEIDIDPELIEVAFSNLLDNGSKYSNGSAHITVKIIPHEREMEIIFQDKGIGIPEADLKNIFQRFYRVNKEHSKKLGGSGLGLSIVETIIQKHFGTISVDSKLGEGTTFTVRLPYNLSDKLAGLQREIEAPIV